MDNKQLTNIATTLAVVETEVKGINRRLDKIDHHFEKLNNTQEKQWSGISKNQVAIGKVMERTHLSPCNPLKEHEDEKEAHGAQAALINSKTAIAVALITALGGGFIGGLIQNSLLQAILR